MVMDRTRTLWLTTDPKPPRSKDDAIGAPLTWLKDVANAITPTPQNKDLVSAVQAETWAALSNYTSNKDCFGNSRHYVPLLSLSTLSKNLTDAINALEKIEVQANKYTAAEETAEADHESMKADLDNLAAGTTTVETQANDAQASITKNLVPRVNDAQKSCSDKSAVVKDLLDKLGGQVQAAFGIDAQTLVSALSTMAFSLEGNPATAVQGVSQALNIGLGGYSNVLDRSGMPVPKDSILGSVRSLEGDLKTSLVDLKDGFKDVSGSYSLLVNLDKLQGLCDKFIGSLPDAGPLSNALNDYIAAIIHRNEVVNEYNTAIRQWLDLRIAVDRLNAQHDQLSDKFETDGTIGLADAASFSSGLHARMRTECLRQTVAVARAASLFCLSDVDLPIGVSDPSGFTAADATSAATTFNSEALGYLNEALKPIGTFPQDEKPDKTQTWYSFGVLVVLTPKVHPDIFKNLIELGVAQFEIDLPTQSSTTPQSVDEPTLAAHGIDSKRTDSSTAHPFAKRANVRLSRVRIFAEGLAGTPLIHLVHTGTERFVHTDGSVFPDSTGSVFCNEAVLQHERIILGYQYTAKPKFFDPMRGFSVDVVKGVGTIDFGDLQTTPTMKDINYAYASIGPFAGWSLELDDGIDASSITRILIDFHGKSQELLKDNV